MKDWILKTFFKKKIYDIQKHFYTEVMKAATEDVKATFAEDVDTRATELMEQKLLEMLSTVDYRKVVYFDKVKGMVFINGERVDEGRLANLHQEAEFILQTDLWQLMYETPKELAQQAMFVQGESMADLQKGKSILFTLASQKKIIDLFKSYSK